MKTLSGGAVSVSGPAAAGEEARWAATGFGSVAVRDSIVVIVYTTGGRPRRVINQTVDHFRRTRPPGSTRQPSSHPENQGRSEARPSAVRTERATWTAVQVPT